MHTDITYTHIHVESLPNQHMYTQSRQATHGHIVHLEVHKYHADTLFTWGAQVSHRHTVHLEVHTQIQCSLWGAQATYISPWGAHIHTLFTLRCTHTHTHCSPWGAPASGGLWQWHHASPQHQVVLPTAQKRYLLVLYTHHQNVFPTAFVVRQKKTYFTHTHITYPNAQNSAFIISKYLPTGNSSVMDK